MSAPMPAIRSPTGPPPPPQPPRRSRGTTTTTVSFQEAPPPPPPPHTNLSSRRAAVLLLLLAAPAASSPSPAAAAFSLGIPGPKELLREQKKKSARFVLAPIDASRQSLLKAQILLTTSANAAPEDAEEVRRLLGAAARDCVPRQRNSLVALQSRTGVEVCTFSLILKNAASLLADKDPVKVEADARLSELIKSFSDLGIAVENSNFELAGDREKMEDGLMGTISALDKFEQGVKDCLGV